MISRSNTEIVFLMLQFLDEERFKETIHKLERESGVFFNVKYFEELVLKGEWEEVEKYLSGFIRVDDNRYSMKIFFEVRKQRYLEALDRRDHDHALEILMRDLKVFSSFSEDLFRQIALLLTLGNFRENENLAQYGDVKTARALLFGELKKLIKANPVLQEKIKFPTFKKSRLRTLLNQSLNWQHRLCHKPKPNPEMKSLFSDHNCGLPDGFRASSALINLIDTISRGVGFPPLSAHGIPPTIVQQAVNAIAVPLNDPAVATPKRPRTPFDNPAVEDPAEDSEHVQKRSRVFEFEDEVDGEPITLLPVPRQVRANALDSSEDLPKNVVANLIQGSVVKSMDFHPFQQNLLLVGTYVGDIALWEVGGKQRLALRNFEIWNDGFCLVNAQASLPDEYTSANKVTWSPDGSYFGVAFSKDIVQLYTYHGGSDIRNHFEISAHAGNVSDLAFCHLDKQLCFITCGEDMIIKVWDADTGFKQYNFEGHEAPLYSVCPYYKEDSLFIFSTDIEGNIKTWSFDKMDTTDDYDLPNHSRTTMAYSADGRLFVSGTNNEGDSYLVEWDESERTHKRLYQGLAKRVSGVLKFDIMKNRYLAAGDEFVVKFWDMDSSLLLTTVDARGRLPASPCIRFNKEGTLLAVSTTENGVKVLANADGVRFMRSMESRAPDTSGDAYGSSPQPPPSSTYGTFSSTAGTSTAVANNGELEKPKIWKLTEITEASQLRSLRLPDGKAPSKIIRLTYTNSGVALLALPHNGVHRLWKWLKKYGSARCEKATASVRPKLWDPLIDWRSNQGPSTEDVSMKNGISETNPGDAVSCLALAKNDGYALSSSGGKISLFNLMTFKAMATYTPPPPGATFLAFHPKDNNVAFIGMEDSSIQVYDLPHDEVEHTLQGHEKRVTGLAFSTVLNVLVSSGADSQLCVWNMDDNWVKLVSKFLQMPSGQAQAPPAETRIQFHQDQKHLLVVHESQIAIFEAPNLECIKQWIPQESSPITDATYSCDYEFIYVTFGDGSVNVLTASTLRLICRISPLAYMPTFPGYRVYPLVVAAHPSEPHQFALGLSDGGVYVMEPLEWEGKWGMGPPPDNGAGPSITAMATGSVPAIKE